MFPQEERLFMVSNIKFVKEAYINEGSGVIDFLPTLDLVKSYISVCDIIVHPYNPCHPLIINRFV